MYCKKYHPNSGLKPFIVHYWTMQSLVEENKGDIFRFIPDAYVDWVFHFNSNWKFKNHRENEFKEINKFHVFGQLKTFIDVEQNSDKIDVFGIKFNPFFVKYFLKDDLFIHTNNFIDLLDLKIPKMKKFIDSLENSVTIQEKIQLSNNFLLNLIEDFSLTKKDFLLNSIFSKNKLNSKIGKRRLEQRYKKEVGISPNRFLRIHNFNYILSDIIKNKEFSLTQLAYKYGYFDQSHFIKDFKLFTGVSPSSFLKSIKPSGELFNLKV